MGAMALFGEKYGDKVRCVRFGQSIELCGGTHASSTGRIGMINIMSETAVAAGVRRIEAVSGEACEEYFNAMVDMMKEMRSLFAASPNVLHSVKKMIEEDARLKAELERFQKEKVALMVDKLKEQAVHKEGISLIELNTDSIGADAVKDMAFRLRDVYSDLCFIASGETDGKVGLTLMLGESLVAQGKDAAALIRQAAKHIKGGGGGQKHFATAGGKDASGLLAAVEEIKRNVLE